MTESVAPKPLTLVVVDDHEVVRQGLVALLGRRPEFHVVAEAGTAADAVTAARRFRPDLVVMDVRLPDGSGIELCKQLNKMSPTVPCIFYTGDAYEVQRREAEEAGANAFVPKPDVDALLETVQKFLSESECAAA